MHHLSFFCASYKPAFTSRIMAFQYRRSQRRIKGIFLLVLLLTGLPHNVLAAESRLATTSGYNTALINKNCDGFAQIPVTSIQGTCVGLVAAKTARYGAIEFAKKMDELAANESQSIKVTNLFSKNNLPNPAGIAVAPNGMIYIGLPTGIMKFKLQRSDNGEIKIDPELEVFINDFDQVRKFSQNWKPKADSSHIVITTILAILNQHAGVLFMTKITHDFSGLRDNSWIVAHFFLSHAIRIIDEELGGMCKKNILI